MPLFKKKIDKKILSLHGMVIKYVTERIHDEDIVIGKAGSVTIRNGEMIILSSNDIIFRAKLPTISYSDLLSGDGVILTGDDEITSKENRKIIIYFVYYRK